MWKKNENLSDACKLCGVRQSLPHVLNQCSVALKLRRYNTRHDAVLQAIVKRVRPLLVEGDRLIADLPETQPYMFPPHLANTDLRPDLVIWNDHTHMVCIVELTICYETRFEEAHALKETKYTDLVQTIHESTTFTPELITLEVGSRGPFNPRGFDKLKDCVVAPTKEWNRMLNELTRVVILESHKIWTKRNWRDQEQP